MNLYKFPCDNGEVWDDKETWDELVFADSMEEAIGMFQMALVGDTYNSNMLKKHLEWVNEAKIEKGAVKWN